MKDSQRKELQDIVHYVFEVGQLKRESRAGWKKVLIPNPEPVAGHVVRASQLAYILALMEGMSQEKAQKAACAMLFHDNTETRGSDMDWVLKTYVQNKAEVEERVHKDQMEWLPEAVQKGLNEYHKLLEKNDAFANVCHDADQLECAFQAAEYLHSGYLGARRFLDAVCSILVTDSAMKLFYIMKDSDPIEWVSEARLQAKQHAV